MHAQAAPSPSAGQGHELLVAVEKGKDLCLSCKHAEVFQSEVLLCLKVDTGKRGLPTDLPTC